METTKKTTGEKIVAKNLPHVSSETLLRQVAADIDEAIHNAMLGIQSTTSGDLLHYIKDDVLLVDVPNEITPFNEGDKFILEGIVPDCVNRSAEPVTRLLLYRDNK